ncbi:MAG: hypothetical protein J1E16_09040 [Muribaculaceae bacterium]|nr:hypothetical protein [Muribaculaceae bacterium]
MPKKKDRDVAITAKPLTGHETDGIYSYCRMGKTEMTAITAKPLTGHETDRPSLIALEERPRCRL